MKMRQRRRRRAHAACWACWASGMVEIASALDLLNDYYKLEGREVVRCSALEHIRQAQREGIHIEGGDTTIKGVRVSTIFLGFDHNYSRRLLSGTAAPILFETMIFGAPDDHPLSDARDRYSTYDEAEAGHAHYCALLAKELH